MRVQGELGTPMSLTSRPGDWQCPNQSCVNSVKMVFARKTECPKCGHPKPSSGGDGGGHFGGHGLPSPRSGMPFGGHGLPGLVSPRPASIVQLAPQFKPAPQPGRGISESPGEPHEREEDWQCSNVNCINHTRLVFGKHSACPSCGASKNADRAGDWQCPNIQCPNHRNSVFAKHLVCPKCRTPRPQRGRIGSPMPMLMRTPMAMPTPAMNYGPAPPMRMPSGGPAGQIQSNDWQCPNIGCLNHVKFVFGKYTECPKCGAPKGAGKGAARPNPNDWQCPNQGCLNHIKLVFAKNDQCPKCGEARPENGSRERSRSPHGVFS
mmetsp:Transcript_30628/g.55880  ORF Transcript_30628/g.55880 Transcript_30628/m.55880 type:complete len:321 (+) Transcript_30628:104-1066(+)